MTDHELEQRLRAWYRAEVGDEAAPSTLRARLADATDVAPAGLSVDRRTLVLLAAAAMLAVAAIGSALAIGSGLIRPPSLDDDSLSTVYGAGWCEPALADGLVLTFEADELPTLTDLPRYFVYEDGRVLRLDPSATSFDPPVPPAERKGWTQRNLTPEGLQHLLGSAQAIDATGCEAIYIGDTGYQEYALKTRVGGDVAQVMFGTGLFQTGATDPDAMAAAADLASRFADPDLGLPPSDWIDHDWLPWVPERYVVTTNYSGTVEPSSDAWDVTLPDGSTPRTFGETVPGTAEAGLLMWRCGIVSAEEARAIFAAFDAAGLVTTFELTGVSRGLDFGDGGGIRMEALPPHPVDCQSHALALGIPTAPQDIVTPDPEVADVSVCDLMAGDISWNDASEWDPGDGWAACRRWGFDDSGFADVFLRMRATSAAEALELVRLEFGQRGYVSDNIAGRTVYFNECVRSSIPCAPAIAISAEPYYVLIRVEQTDPPTDPEERLRELAERIIHNLED